MRFVFTSVIALTFTLPVFGQELSISDQLVKMQKDNQAIQSQLTAQGEQINTVLSLATRQKADISAVADKLVEVSSKLDAMIAASKVTMVAQPSATWGGPSTFVATTAGSQPVPAMAMSMTSGYSSSAMTCAGGSCGSGAGRMRLFGRGR